MRARAFLLGTLLLSGFAGGVAAQSSEPLVSELRWLSPGGAAAALSEVPAVT